MKRVINIFLREAKLVAGESSLLLTLLLAPLIYAFLYGSIYLNKDERNVKLAVADLDRSALSRLLINEINSTRMVDVFVVADLKTAEEAMLRGDAQGYLEIHPGMEANIYSLKQAPINLYINSSQFLPASAVLSTLNEVALTVGGGARKVYFEKQGLGNAAALQMTNPVRFDYRPLFNEGKNYGTFLIPGLLAIILQQTLLIGLCAAMAEEREKNSLQPLLANNTVSQVILGKGLFYWFSFLVFGFFFITVNFTLLETKFRGSYGDVFVLTSVFVGCIITLAMLVGSFFRSTLMAFQIMGFSSYPIFMITGYSVPSQSLPEVVNFIANLMPTAPYLKTYISIVQLGGTLADNSQHLVHILILWMVYIILLLWRFSFIKNKNGYATKSSN